MKKIYSLLLTALFCLIGQEASAFSLFLEIDHPENLASVERYVPGSTTAINIFGTQPIQVDFPDEGTRYLYITLNTGCFMTEISITDEDGKPQPKPMTIMGNGPWKGKQTIMIKEEYDYGTISIKTSATQPMDAKMTVNLNGNPANVDMYLGSAARQVELKKGQQTVDFTSNTESTVYLMPRGVTKFYKVTLDGNEVPGNGTSDESGNISYQYTVGVKNGSVLQIDVNYPNVSRNCAITVSDGMENFIESVTLDGAAVANWKSFKAKLGAKLVIKANTNDYDVETFTYNGRDCSFTVGSWDTIIESDDDVNINITGAAIERPYSARIITYNWNYIGQESKGFYRYECRRADNKSITIESGENIVKFNEKEMPLNFLVGADDFGAVHVNINDEAQTPNSNGEFHLYLKDGDIVQVGLSVEPPSAITTLPSAVSRQSSVYTIQGVKANVNNLPAGIYIKEGKKMVVK